MKLWAQAFNAWTRAAATIGYSHYNTEKNEKQDLTLI